MKILLAIDTSTFGNEMVSELSRRPWPSDSEFRIINVDLPVQDVRRRGELPTAFDEMVQRQRAEAIRHLDAAAAIVRKNAPNLIVTTILREGYPKDEIVKEAEHWGADLIVVKPRGHGPIRRFFLGSVSASVAKNAPCSVEIFRARRSRRQSFRPQLAGC